MKNLILIGFKSAGKTTLGQKVAAKLHCSFVDTDDFFQPSPREVVRQIGEASFRALEQEFLQTLSSVTRYVIATGGGIVLDPGNRHLLRELGIVVHLQTLKETIKNRIFSSELPTFLEGSNAEERFEETYHDRLGIYTSMAHHNIITEAELWEVIRLDPFSE